MPWAWSSRNSQIAGRSINITTTLRNYIVKCINWNWIYVFLWSCNSMPRCALNIHIYHDYGCKNIPGGIFFNVFKLKTSQISITRKWGKQTILDFYNQYYKTIKMNATIWIRIINLTLSKVNKCQKLLRSNTKPYR